MHCVHFTPGYTSACHAAPFYCVCNSTGSEVLFTHITVNVTSSLHCSVTAWVPVQAVRDGERTYLLVTKPLSVWLMQAEVMHVLFQI